LQSVHDELSVLPELYTDCFDLTVNGVPTFGFLMRCVTSMMVEPYKPQAHKASYKFMQGRLKLLNLVQLERAYQDVKTISEYTINVKFVHDLQLLLQDVGEDTGRIFHRPRRSPAHQGGGPDPNAAPLHREHDQEQDGDFMRLLDELSTGHRQHIYTYNYPIQTPVPSNPPGNLFFWLWILRAGQIYIPSADVKHVEHILL